MKLFQGFFNYLEKSTVAFLMLSVLLLAFMSNPRLPKTKFFPVVVFKYEAQVLLLLFILEMN